MAIVATESGNQYIVGTISGRHAVINTRTGATKLAPEGAVFPDIHLGESWVTPMFTTSPVEAVLARYTGSATADMVIDDESPFSAASDVLSEKERKITEDMETEVAMMERAGQRRELGRLGMSALSFSARESMVQDVNFYRDANGNKY
jgi:hypothetical protein